MTNEAAFDIKWKPILKPHKRRDKKWHWENPDEIYKYVYDSRPVFMNDNTGYFFAL